MTTWLSWKSCGVVGGCLFAATVCCALFLAAGRAAESSHRENRATTAQADRKEEDHEVLHFDSVHHHPAAIKGAAEWVKPPAGSGLVFNGVDTYVDCGKDPSLNISDQGTIEVWFNPQARQGGLVTWSTGTRWEDQRLVLAFNTWQGQCSLVFCVADGNHCETMTIPLPRTNSWHHLAVTFTGHIMQVFHNGVFLGTRAQMLQPKLENVPLRIGRCEGLGQEYFRGTIGGVFVHRRALSEQQILERFLSSAKGRGLDVTGLRRMQLVPRPYAEFGQLLVEADLRTVRPLFPLNRIDISLANPETRQTVRTSSVEVSPAMSRAKILISLDGLPPRTYLLRAVRRGADGAPVEPEVNQPWTLSESDARIVRARNTPIKVLNNLVAELLTVTEFPDGQEAEWAFTNPREGWVFVSSTVDAAAGGTLSAILDGDSGSGPLFVPRADLPTALEAMRYLSPGRHMLRVRSDPSPLRQKAKTLVVRRVPELIFCKFPSSPQIPEFGPYDWAFLRRHVLDHVNTLVGDGSSEHLARIEEWTKRGGRSIVEVGATPFFKAQSEDEAYRFWSETPGFKDPRLGGIIVDEFAGGEDIRYDAVNSAVRRLVGARSPLPSKRAAVAPQEARPDGTGNLAAKKVFYPYCGSMYGATRSEDFIQTVIDGGSRFAWERYLREQPDPFLASQFLEASLSLEMEGWESRFPRCAQHMIVCLGYMVTTESLGHFADVDWKVWMDMQFHHLANDPKYFGLYGLMEYTCSYADEETVRWAARLYRHYGIEGRTDLLSPQFGFRYQLDHLRNSDFENGLASWNVEAADETSVAARTASGYGWQQGRYPRTRKGDTFLWTKRSAQKPNRVRQEIRNLQAGRLYSLKMLTADFGDLKAGRSIEQKHAVSMRIEGVELIPGKAFQSVFPNNYAHRLDPYGPRRQLWLNQHWRVFRALHSTAQLVLTDWASDTSPGGAAGQELMYNMIEVQPYFE